MTDGLQLMRIDDGTGVSGTRPERRFPAPPRPIGSPFHDIGNAMVAKQKLIDRRTILCHAQLGRRTSPGESRFRPILITSRGKTTQISASLIGFDKRPCQLFAPSQHKSESSQANSHKTDRRWLGDQSVVFVSFGYDG